MTQACSTRRNRPRASGHRRFPNFLLLKSFSSEAPLSAFSNRK